VLQQAADHRMGQHLQSAMLDLCTCMEREWLMQAVKAGYLTRNSYHNIQWMIGFLEGRSKFRGTTLLIAHFSKPHFISFFLLFGVVLWFTISFAKLVIMVTVV